MIWNTVYWRRHINNVFIHATLNRFMIMMIMMMMTKEAANDRNLDVAQWASYYLS